MSPPCPSFDVSELPARVQQDSDGRRRKLDGSARRIELSACDLFKMNQWECELKDESMSQSPISCWPVTRFFRM
ncbi:mitochondrial export protein som1 domain-containing protein [Cordyceps javanica]|uniref:Mitochondrial export protein som1 domain-containing protein n=1 Tax=Cordyceps javanica TaxID=43265 RepID=A0A545UWT3_9HYPO|nr:mitochondrial export protein som1 domain-containing protein [Cordyceps javanica]